MCPLVYVIDRFGRETKDIFHLVMLNFKNFKILPKLKANKNLVISLNTVHYKD